MQNLSRRLRKAALIPLLLLLPLAGCFDYNQSFTQADSCGTGQKIGAKLGDMAAARISGKRSKVAQQLGLPEFLRNGGEWIGSQISCGLMIADQKKTRSTRELMRNQTDANLDE